MKQVQGLLVEVHGMVCTRPWDKQSQGVGIRVSAGRCLVKQVQGLPVEVHGKVPLFRCGGPGS